MGTDPSINTPCYSYPLFLSLHSLLTHRHLACSLFFYSSIYLLFQLSLRKIIMPTPTPTPTFDGVATPSNPQESRDLPTFLSCSYPITLKFMDVQYRLKTQDKQTTGGSIKRLLVTHDSSSPSDQRSTGQERTILKGVTGIAHPGEILAVLGPSGSGKSTLLNALAGRLHGHGLTGSILANSSKLTKPVLRRTGFVTQDDILYPHLTVRETLVFCAMLRLPRPEPRAAKVAAAEEAISELGLGKCQHTIIGNGFIRGVSGGERKRVSIAHEMLVDPSLLVLDEPTSDLASLAKKGKTVVTSVHQPSSRVYQMFDKVLLLSEGQCLYFGKGAVGRLQICVEQLVVRVAVRRQRLNCKKYKLEINKKRFT